MTLNQIPVWPVYTEGERKAVDRVLASGRVNYWGGQEGSAFEQEFATWCGVSHGLCVFNGTIALEIALRSCGIEQGDEIIVTPRSFLASASAVVAIGAIPVFADIDLDSGNLTAESIASVITDRTRGVVVVHLGGWPADMPAIMKLASEHDLKIVEDCAQAHGASINGQRVGSFGHAAAFSFCQDKIMSTGGEGGMVITNDDQVCDNAWSLRDHGRNREMTLIDNHPFGFRWLQDRFGTNGRMTEMQAAIGRCQLRKVDKWLLKRAENARSLKEAMREIESIYVPSPEDHVTHAYYRFSAIFKDFDCRDDVVQKLQSAGIPAAVGPCPEIYREKAFSNAGMIPLAPLPVAADLGKRSMVLPIHPGMESIFGLIIDQITKIVT